MTDLVHVAAEAGEDSSNEDGSARAGLGLLSACVVTGKGWIARMFLQMHASQGRARRVAVSAAGDFVEVGYLKQCKGFGMVPPRSH